MSRDLVRAVCAQRLIKTDEEIAEIENALDVTAEMYRVAMTAARPGRREYEIAGLMQARALELGRQQAFTPIVSVRGEVLHNHSYDNTLADGDLLLMDSGAESPRCYASDITRTFPVSGRFSDRQRRVYEIVLAAQMAVINAASPEHDNREMHRLAARTIAGGLTALGLMKGDPDDAVEVGAHALFFPHGIGHMMGLDVHDMEDLGDIVGYPEGEQRSTQFGLGFLRMTRRLEPGFVITVEPGIYFIPALIDQWRGEGRHSGFHRLRPGRNLQGIRRNPDRGRHPHHRRRLPGARTRNPQDRRRGRSRDAGISEPLRRAAHIAFSPPRPPSTQRTSQRHRNIDPSHHHIDSTSDAGFRVV